MKALERRRGHVAGALEGQTRVDRITPADLRALEQEIQSRLGNWRSILRRHPQQARQMLSKLVTARMRFTPHVEGEERWYDFAAECTLGSVVGGALHSKQWWPQRDSIKLTEFKSAISLRAEQARGQIGGQRTSLSPEPGSCGIGSGGFLGRPASECSMLCRD